MNKPLDLTAVIDHLAANTWFADADEILRYLNKNAEANCPDVLARLGNEVDGCHKPENRGKVRAMFDRWRSGSRHIEVSSHAKDGQVDYHILIPAHAADGFKGVLELAFKVPEGPAPK
ncbi:MAG TPA: PAS domain-containing protein [Bacillota bacterium]|jgi:DUF438 domain-containing protein